MTTSGEQFTFNPEKHEYKIGRRKLTSVTTLLKDYFSPFDTKAVAKKVADIHKAKNGRKYRQGETITKEDRQKATQKYWKAQWKLSSEHGTNVHKGIEEAILNQANAINVMQEYSVEERDLKKMLQGWTYLSTRVDRDTGLRPELKIYDKELGLAGTIDLLVIQNNKASLVDWKTNKSIDKTGYNKACALPPIEHMPDCNYTKYGLQLGIYAYMLERQGYEIDTLVLLHLKENTYIPYEIPYKTIKKDVEAILNDYKKRKKDKQKRSRGATKTKAKG